MSLLPSSPDVTPDSEPRVVGLDTEEADDLMAALASETARRLLAELHEDPAPPGRLAERADTSLQNAQYHLGNLESAGAVEVVGTAYSEKGREMQVYGPSDRPLVIFAGEKERASGLRAAISRLFGGFAALAGGALVVQELFGRSILRLSGDDAAPGGGPAGDGGGGATATPTPDPETTPTERSDADAEGGAATDTTTPVDDSEDTGPAESPTETAEPEGTQSPGEQADEDAGGGAEAGDAADAETFSGTETETPTPTEFDGTPVPDGGAWDLDLPGLFDGLLASGMPPGLAFFLGGATVLTFLVATTYVRAQP